MRNKSLLSLAIFASLSLGGCITIHDTQVSLPAAIAQTSSAPIVWKEILPPPPSIDSKYQAADMNEVLSYQSPEFDTRRQLAKADNEVNPFKAYSSIIGTDFSAENYPKTKELMNYALTYAGLQINNTKQVYERKRPFQENDNIKICVDKPPGGSSYPSGHSASGWLSANILARLFQDKSDAIYARGLDYGKSRVICGVHYPSDIAMGRIVGDILLGKLQNDAQFVTLFNNARAEIGKKSK